MCLNTNFGLNWSTVVNLRGWRNWLSPRFTKTRLIEDSVVLLYGIWGTYEKKSLNLWAFLVLMHITAYQYADGHFWYEWTKIRPIRHTGENVNWCFKADTQNYLKKKKNYVWILVAENAVHERSLCNNGKQKVCGHLWISRILNSL